MSEIIDIIYNVIRSVLHAIWKVWYCLEVVVAWILYVLAGLLDGTIIDRIGATIRLAAFAAFDILLGFFSGIQHVDTSTIFSAYCAEINWFIPVDFAAGCVGIYFSALFLRLTIGWIMSFARII